MATGELPWNADTTVQMALEILGAHAPDRRRLDGVADVPLRDLLATMLEPDPDLRLADAGEVERRLAAVTVLA
jgi:hypothetical protein